MATTTGGEVAAEAGGAPLPGGAPPRQPPGSGTDRHWTVFSRVTVVAPRTRIDVALPTDVAVADLLPTVLELAGETSPDGGSRHGGWCLTRVGAAPLDPSRTLAAAEILDGDLLQLRRRAEAPQPPLFDDVVDAIAGANPDSYRPWTEATARRLGMAAAGTAQLAAAVALLAAGQGTGTGTGVGLAGAAVAAGVAGVAAVACVVFGALLVRGFREPDGGVLVAAGALPLAFVAGVLTVPPAPGPGWLGLGPPNLLLGNALVLVVAALALLLLGIGIGITTFVAATTAGLLGVLAFLVATLVGGSAAGIAAGAAAVALAGLSLLPRLAIRLARLPLPQVPGSAEELAEDDALPDYSGIEHQTGTAHRYLTGLIVGCAAVAAVAAVVVAASGGAFSWALGVVVAVLLLLRARTYANGSQAVALLVCGIVAAGGVALDWVLAAAPLQRLVVAGALLLAAALALALGVVFPGHRFSPPLRRAVDVTEAVLIAAVVPLALAVMDLYHAIETL